MDDPRNTAMHEAAHAVAAVRLGLRLTSVDGPNEEWGTVGSVGVAEPADYSIEKYPEFAKAQAVSALAGLIVEIRHWGARRQAEVQASGLTVGASGPPLRTAVAARDPDSGSAARSRDAG